MAIKQGATYQYPAVNPLQNPIGNAPDLDMSTYRNRGTVVVETGVLTSVATVTSITNVVFVGTYQAQDMVIAANLSAWVLACRERIS